MSSPDELLALFKSIGLSEQKAKETLKNEHVTKTLARTVAVAEKLGGNKADIGTLLYHLATKIKVQSLHHLPLLVQYISGKKLTTSQRVDAALEHLLSTPVLDVEAFEHACGVGIVVTPEQIESCIEVLVKKHRAEILEKRYRFNLGAVLQAARTELRWADGAALKAEMDMQVLDLLGPKTAEDLAPAKDKKKATPQPAKASKGAEVETSGSSTTTEALSITDMLRSKAHFHRPGENFKTDGYVTTPRTHELLAQHLKETGGQVRTRFPPEPNGILHVGHAKAININFGYAAAHGGVCFLRYDDTNPEKEEEKFFVGILEAVRWLGYEPYRITHSSDYFDQLYAWAVKLIEKGLAFVCHQSADDMKGFDPPPSPWRERPIAESLRLFADMRAGKIDEGAATLRMKVTLEEGKRDPVAYRIKFLPHHRTGDKWCVYPTYDYTHCLCDSIENITHSLCTKEFQNRRSSYYWLCNALDIYCPVQWEYGRLNVDYTVVSKRKIGRLITERVVNDWDDPRLFTLAALRRRGFPSTAINTFCAQMGVTGAQAAVDPSMLEACARDVLNATARRAMVVLDAVRVVLTNFPGERSTTVVVPDLPGQPGSATHDVPLDSVVFIERDDFRQVPEKGYRRLCPGQSVGLRHAGLVITVTKVNTDADGNVTEIEASCESTETAPKPKAFIHWVSQPITVEVRLYSRLFRHRNPEDSAAVPGGFLSDCADDTLRSVMALADRSLHSARPGNAFQFERLGFFCADPDSAPGQLVFNRTVTLKEDAGKA